MSRVGSGGRLGPKPGTTEGVAVFRDAMAMLLSAVYVVTTWDEIGRPRGFTATSVVPLTRQPPRVVVAIDHAAASHDALTSGDQVGLAVLAGDQHSVAALFASKRPDKFERVPWSGDRGVPILEGSAADAVCRVETAIAHGDHTILIGVVEDARVGTSDVLVVYDRAFLPTSDPSVMPPPRSTGAT